MALFKKSKKAPVAEQEALIDEEEYTRV